MMPQLSAGGKNGESGLLKPSAPEKKLCWSLTAGSCRDHFMMTSATLATYLPPSLTT